MVSANYARTLRIFHVSDLHERGQNRNPMWRYRRVLGDAWQRNLDQVLQDGPIDLICFTGDVAFSGKPEEYDYATSFFSALRDHLHVPPERLFIIPGNHDVDRSIAAREWKALRKALHSGVDAGVLSNWIAGTGKVPNGFKTKWIDAVLSRQYAFRQWLGTVLQRRELLPSASPHGLLGYRVTVNARSPAYPLHILGLDTSWLCGADGEAGELWLTEDQLMRLATDEDGKPLPGLRIALMHHPFHELADGTQCRKLLAGFVDLTLRGHLHETEIEVWADPSRQVRQFAAGCLYEHDRYPNACQLITLSVDGDGAPTEVNLHFRAWSPKGGHWHDDDALYKESHQGRLNFFIGGSREVAAANPYDPYNPVVPPTFVNRSKVLRRLGEALDQGLSVSIIGDWRLGKSSLLKTWAGVVRERGREVKRLSGEGPEGVSPGAFVQAITGEHTSDDPDAAADALARFAERSGTPGLKPLILVDEVDGIIPRFEHRFFERLRGMLDSISFLLASRRELDLIYEEIGRTSPFHNRLALHWIGLLEPEAAEEIISRGQPVFSPRDPEIMRDLAGRHPFYLQLLGHHLVDARRLGEPHEAAIDRFMTEAAARLRELWRTLTPTEQQALGDLLKGKRSQLRTLRVRGLVTDDGKAFGGVLLQWLKEQA